MKKRYKIIIIAASILTATTFMKLEIVDSYIKQNIKISKSGNLILVNKNNPLQPNYKPENLVKCNIPFIDSSVEEEKYLQEEASKSIEKLFAQAKEEGIELLGTSAYRSYSIQKRVFNKNVKTRGIDDAKKYAAKPGKSEHQTGLAIDVTNTVRWFDKSTKEAIWLANNAHKFGFVLRFPEGKEHITGYNFEPWHIRYVGKEIAKAIYVQNITLEEYLQNK